MNFVKVLFFPSVSKSSVLTLVYSTCLCFLCSTNVFPITASLPLLMLSTNHVLNSSRTHSTDAKPALFFSRVTYRRIMKFYRLHSRSTIAVIAGIYIFRRGRGKSVVIYTHIIQNNIWDECRVYVYALARVYCNEQATRATGSVDRNCIIFLAICEHILRSEIEIALEIMATGIRRFNSQHSSLFVIIWACIYRIL